MTKLKLKLKKDRCQFCGKKRELSHMSEEVRGRIVYVKFCDDCLPSALDKLGYERIDNRNEPKKSR